jgi:TolB-like protein/Tfp pilus assembly protein PilF
MSDLVYRAIRARSDFMFEYIGERIVKNIPDPINVYQLHGRDVAASLKPSPRQRSQEDAGRAAALLEAERPSIAVLPFRNLSGDPEQEFFAEGVADDIITNLCRFRTVDVIARGSSFAFHDGSVPITKVGQQLQARYIAEGSVRRAASRVRVSVELSDAVSGRLIWAERYDRALEDIFIIQDEIASLAVAAMSASIDNAEQQRWKTTPPESLRAYGLVLKGTAHIHHYTSRDNNVARVLFEQALENEPDYARSYAGLSRAHNLSWRYRWTDDPQRSLERAFELAVQAVQADPNDARGHAELGFVQLYRREHDRSLACYRRALVLNPNEANIIAEYGDTLAHAGEAAASLDYFDRAMRLNPLYPDTYLWYKAGALTKLRRFEEAISAIQSMNNPAQGRRLLACCYAFLGRLADAQREAELIRAAQPGFNADHWAREIVPDRRAEDIELFASGLKAAGL